jgi:hypothetical protein
MAPKIFLVDKRTLETRELHRESLSKGRTDTIHHFRSEIALGWVPMVFTECVANLNEIIGVYTHLCCNFCSSRRWSVFLLSIRKGAVAGGTG